jgi:hypothetical protein
MKRTLLIIIWVTLFVAGTCQHKPTKYFSHSTIKGNAAKLPISFINGLPVIKVFVNNKGPFLFVLDIGTNTVIVSSKLFTEAGLLKNGKVRADDGSGRNIKIMDKTSITNITMNQFMVSNVLAVVSDVEKQLGKEVSGVIGLAMFKKHLLTLDFQKNELHVKNGRLSAGENILPFKEINGTPAVPIEIGTYKFDAIFDSGNSGFLSVSDSFLPKFDLASEPVVVGEAETINNKIPIKQARINHSLVVGKLSFANPVIEFNGLLSQANIGIQLMKKMTLTFDQVNKMVRIDKVKTIPMSQQYAGDINELSGKYGIRKLKIIEGNLYMQREGGQDLKLAMKSRDEFFVELVPEVVIKIIRDSKNKVIGMKILNQQGQWEEVSKE